MLNPDEKRKIAELAKDAASDYEWGYDYDEALERLKKNWPDEVWEGEPWDELLDKPGPPTPYVRGQNPITDIMRDIYLPQLAQMLENSNTLLAHFTDISPGTPITIGVRKNNA